MSSIEEKSIITQAKTSTHFRKVSLNKSQIQLNLRGNTVTISREILLNFPDSISTVLFPQGIHHDTIDFDFEMFMYIFKYYTTSKAEFNQKHQSFHDDIYLAYAVVSGTPLSPLVTRQGIIVIHEDLNYFVITPTSSNTSLKLKCHEYLMKQNKIFDFLSTFIQKQQQQQQQQSVEQQLIHLLCRSAGYKMGDTWGYRSIEPNKTNISSISLSSIGYDKRIQTGQSLMIFYKKPAVIQD